MFLRDRSGTAALEFALLAIPFIVLLTAIIESTMIFVAQQVLQTATTQAGRLIMTGQAQTQNMTQSKFHDQVCSLTAPMFVCGSVYVNVQTFASFQGITTPTPLTNGAPDQTKMVFNPGNPGDIELVQVFYNWPVITGLPGLNLATSGSTRLLKATAVFRNEPY
jgi:Flp pilus assembly protein TadG